MLRCKREREREVGRERDRLSHVIIATVVVCVDKLLLLSVERRPLSTDCRVEWLRVDWSSFIVQRWSLRRVDRLDQVNGQVYSRDKPEE